MPYYAAYGINTNNNHMASLCPDARKVEHITISNCRLAYRAGFLTIIPQEGREVKCLLWEISSKDEQSLDAFEKCSDFYIKETVKINTNNESIDALIYIMNLKEISESDIYKKPSRSYEKRTKKGYLKNSLPEVQLNRAYFELIQESRGIPWDKIQEMEDERDKKNNNLYTGKMHIRKLSSLLKTDLEINNMPGGYHDSQRR